MKFSFAAACLLGMTLAENIELANDEGYNEDNVKRDDNWRTGEKKFK